MYLPSTGLGSGLSLELTLVATVAFFSALCVLLQMCLPNARIPDGISPNCADDCFAGFKVLLFPDNTAFLLFVATDVGGAGAPGALPPPPLETRTDFGASPRLTFRDAPLVIVASIPPLLREDKSSFPDVTPSLASESPLENSATKMRVKRRRRRSLRGITIV